MYATTASDKLTDRRARGGSSPTYLLRILAEGGVLLHGLLEDGGVGDFEKGEADEGRHRWFGCVALR